MGKRSNYSINIMISLIFPKRNDRPRLAVVIAPPLVHKAINLKVTNTPGLVYERILRAGYQVVNGDVILVPVAP